MEYTCRLLNVARHSAFGVQASELVLGNVQNDVDPPQVRSTKAIM